MVRHGVRWTVFALRARIGGGNLPRQSLSFSIFQQSAAAPLDTARVELTGSIPSTCAFTTLPSTTTLGELITGVQSNLGSFGFTCNLRNLRQRAADRPIRQRRA